MINSDLFLIIESSKLKFTAADEQIADYFLNGKPPLKQSALAQKINVSSASVTRFSKKLGFENYKELMYFYRKKLENYSDDSSSVTSNLQFRYKELINEIDERLEIEDIKTVCKHIKDHQIIHIFGLGLSAIAGEDFKFRFTRIGKYVEVVQDYDSIEMISSLLTGENLLIYLSLRGENQHVIQSLKDLKEKGVFIIIITSNQSEEINELADVTLLTSNIKNSSGAGQVSGQIPLLILIDMIYSQYISMYRENVSKWIETEHAYLQGH
ncbi:MurR/RpiR family transcriptional regulator [Virgibacillus sp. MSJ-26]|uniref:MurR/RpiR family transcriptional regulator n=1 Tax=Virgibacillus sp. MSJ-26 TaxID=2841522 RepID=UPI001C0FFD52|nr:MurR/RpiR family transcriptional regulator [Virgibacillus sp. MSJ-26]MBU5465567.1 MurR/RpiR family transcriptional regulator [Virgibacillus sp. MSJ-26]